MCIQYVFCRVWCFHACMHRAAEIVADVVRINCVCSLPPFVLPVSVCMKAQYVCALLFKSLGLVDFFYYF